jgi:acyl CoA:acetate/3-ketoacid CoA transferase alpha subunit
METIYSGEGEYRLTHPDELREWIHTHKSRKLVNKVMDEHEAINKFVQDGDYISYDLAVLARGPMSLIREIIRQKKKDLWVSAKFTAYISTLLVAGGCATKIDVGFIGMGKVLMKAVEEGRVKTIEWTNGMLTLRHLAGAMGIPFLPTWAMMGTDTIRYSGAKIVKEPFLGKKICLVPAVNPDVALVHVNQCDIYGNARVFGASASPLETAMAAKKLIISTEEIIPHEEIRKNPGKTLIPYYFVDAVVEAPFGAYPGAVPGLYSSDPQAFGELVQAGDDEGKMQEYLDKCVYKVKSHQDFLEKCVGQDKMQALKERETIKEGYYL